MLLISLPSEQRQHQQKLERFAAVGRHQGTSPDAIEVRSPKYDVRVPVLQLHHQVPVL